MKRISRRGLSNLVAKTGTRGRRAWFTPGLFDQVVRSQLPAAIEIVEAPLPAKQNYNCFLFALGLHRSQSVLKQSKGFIYSPFLEKLLDLGLLKVTKTHKAGDMVLYRNPSRFGKEFTHAGIVQRDGTVISKWSWGPLLRHRMLDVPSFYGSKLVFVKALKKGQAQKFWSKYHSSNKKK
jgi:hypothetical protein